MDRKLRNSDYGCPLEQGARGAEAGGTRRRARQTAGNRRKRDLQTTDSCQPGMMRRAAPCRSINTFVLGAGLRARAKIISYFAVGSQALGILPRDQMSVRFTKYAAAPKKAGGPGSRSPAGRGGGRASAAAADPGMSTALGDKKRPLRGAALG